MDFVAFWLTAMLASQIFKTRFFEISSGATWNRKEKLKTRILMYSIGGWARGVDIISWVHNFWVPFNWTRPGCNCPRNDFKEEILKSHDFFGINLWSIFSYHKNMFWKLEPKDPFGGPKAAKNWKKAVYLENERPTPSLFLHFSTPYKSGYLKKMQPILSIEKKS